MLMLGNMGSLYYENCFITKQKQKKRLFDQHCISLFIVFVIFSNKTLQHISFYRIAHQITHLLYVSSWLRIRNTVIPRLLQKLIMYWMYLFKATLFSFWIYALKQSSLEDMCIDWMCLDSPLPLCSLLDEAYVLYIHVSSNKKLSF